MGPLLLLLSCETEEEMNANQHATMTLGGVSLRYCGNSGPRCFLADLFDFNAAQGNAVDDIGRMAHTLQMADTIDFGDTPYTRQELEGAAGRQLSRYVVEHSYYARKLFKLYGFLRHQSLAKLTAGPTANLCEDFVGLQNYLFSQLLPQSPHESSERIRECVSAYVDCSNRIKDGFWENPSDVQRTFTCRDTATSGFEVIVDTSTVVGARVREVVLLHRIASDQNAGGPFVIPLRQRWEGYEGRS